MKGLSGVHFSTGLPIDEDKEESPSGVVSDKDQTDEDVGEEQTDGCPAFEKIWASSQDPPTPPPRPRTQANWKGCTPETSPECSPFKSAGREPTADVPFDELYPPSQPRNKRKLDFSDDEELPDIPPEVPCSAPPLESTPVKNKLSLSGVRRNTPRKYSRIQLQPDASTSCSQPQIPARVSRMHNILNDDDISAVRISYKRQIQLAINDSKLDNEKKTFEDEFEKAEFLDEQKNPWQPRFLPLSSETCVQLCKEKKIPCDKAVLYLEKAWPEPAQGKRFGPAGPMCTVHIEPDGNCYFRTISWILTGTQEHHVEIRRKIVIFMRDPQNWQKMKLRIPDNFRSMSAYMRQKEMHKDRVWATEAEIFATTFWLGKDIWMWSTTRECWLPFCASGNTANRTETALFMVHMNNNHFEPVIMMADALED